MSKKYVYIFGGGKAEGNAQMKRILGGKGAGLHEMTRLGIPVPPGFTISTEVCDLFYNNKKQIPKEVEKEVKEAISKIEKITGLKFGDENNPLLFSVRSGAEVSMPGMMDTILNVGLNDATVDGLARKTRNMSFAYDCYRRLIQMFSDVVFGVDKGEFERELSTLKGIYGDNLSSWTEDNFRELIKRYKEIVRNKTGKEFPQDVYTQLKLACEAVFKSWNNPRAISYRQLYSITGLLGTAVNIQTMVFGNKGPTSATGVGFTRNPSTGEDVLYGEYLVNAQGEDVVSGAYTPKNISAMQQEMPEMYEELSRVAKLLEKHYKDMQDFEFTIEEKKLYLLQTRSGKRTGLAAFNIVADLLEKKIITEEEALLRIEPEHIQQLLTPVFDPNELKKYKPIATGLNASPGAACGKVVFQAEKAVECAKKGEKVILVRPETTPDDINGMAVSQGILTTRGGMTSHAAVVSRQMGKPAVVGCGEIFIDEDKHLFTTKDCTVKEGDIISINGATGDVYIGSIPVLDSELLRVLRGTLPEKDAPTYMKFKRILSLAKKYKRLGVKANADTPNDAKTALSFGAEGIGLCRTEHMFFKEERIPYVYDMILADTKEERQKALDKLFEFQREDFKSILSIMKGFPITIRTLDPPLHEFLPNVRVLEEEIRNLKDKLTKEKNEKIEEELKLKEKMLERVFELHEANPMLGTRGCRLGIMYPEITEMQARAILDAVCELKKNGIKTKVQIMIPLVANVNEFKNQKEVIDKVAKEVMKKWGINVKYSVGTMIEVPRAAITADKIAQYAEFFSFGTNDLTQMGYGLSRDDVGKLLNFYVKTAKILEQDPFVTLDTEGIGELVKIGIEKGRRTNPNLEIGICGEHGGEKNSIHFCHKVGMDYVSCSPYRVASAIIEAAKANIKERLEKKHIDSAKKKVRISVKKQKKVASPKISSKKKRIH